MAGTKQTLPIKTFDPGYVKDFADTLNPGCKKFKNLTRSSNGHYEKSKGFTNILNYDETGKDNGNISIDFSRLNNGDNGLPRTSIMHVRVFSEEISGKIYNYKEIIFHKIVNKENTLQCIKIDQNGVKGTSRIIANGTQWINNGKIKFIDTKEQTYIINTNNRNINGVVKGYVWKYNFGKGLITGETDRLFNISISNQVEGPSHAEPIAPFSNEIYPGAYAGHHYYIVVPVYNTGTIGRQRRLRKNEYPPTFFGGYHVITDSSNVAVVLQAYIPYDPYITAYRVYRKKKTTKAWPVGFDYADQDAFRDQSFYFLCQCLAPTEKNNPTIPFTFANPEQPNFQGKIVTDWGIPDEELGSELSAEPYFNSFWHSWMYDLREPFNPPSTVYDNLREFYGSCGCFAQNRLFIGDGNMVFVSSIDHTDSFDLAPYILDLASDNCNPIIAIEEVGINVFAFMKNRGIKKMSSTQSPDIPYVIENASDVIGCDSLNSICTINKTAFFIFKNKLYGMNEFGQSVTGDFNIELSQGLNSVLATLDTTTGAEIILKPNAKDGYVKIMFRTADKAVNIDYYPAMNCWIEQSGNKDVFVASGSTATLLSNDERYQLVNYEYLPDLNEEWGVDLDGNIVKRNTEYSNVSIGSDKMEWLDFTYSDKLTKPAVKSYPVVAEIERPLHFDAKVMVNALVLYGSGNIKYSYALNDGVQVTAKTVLMKKTGTMIMLNTPLTNLFIVRLLHDTAEALDYDFMEIIYNGTHKVTVKNSVSSGAK